MESELSPKFAPFIGMTGIAAAMIFGSIGAAYGTVKSGIGIASVAAFRPDLIIRCLIPVVMSGIIAVYSLVIAVLIAQDIQPPSANNEAYTLFASFMHFTCGLVVGLTGLAAGYCIGIVGDNGVRAYMKQSRVYIGMILILIFGEVLGLYGYANYGLILFPGRQKLSIMLEQTDCRPIAQLSKQGGNQLPFFPFYSITAMAHFVSQLGYAQ
ncbi:uncharacterized protein TrAtP1_002173 [Trichoderma atroviride]|uniref:uncharacterized protein n=1 Tax=Hypocrea atroviridis TaxID=63577 RepID=UPI00331AA570|nr:hypothetical protein TrAtP1_002173 [Trichoderma atroviride]